jgi:exodeoxyribonuclease III
MALLRVVTFNVNSIRSRMPAVTRWLNDNRVDLLCLQETKVQDSEFDSLPFLELGYSIVFRGQKATSGVAIASLEPLADVRIGFGDGEDPDDGPRLIRARLGDLLVINTYVPQGKSLDHPDYAYKLRFFSRMRALLERESSPAEPLVWVGDLNVAPTDSDVTHPENKRDHVCFHEDVKETFEAIKGWGLVDVFRKHRPGEGEFSFFDYRVKDSLARNIGWRIDHVLATKPLAETSVDAWVDRLPRSWERPSDHTPVVAVFDR